MSQSPIRSMTGFARLTGVAPGNTTFVVTLKSVNHRYLDLQFYLPSGMDALEVLWRKTIKEQVVRGHIDVRLSVQRESAVPAPQYNPAVVKAYVEAFRAASSEHKVRGAQPDLNSALRLPGVWSIEAPRAEEAEQTQIELAAAAALQPAMESLNAMRAQEGRVLAEELRTILTRLQKHVDELSSLRAGMQQAQTERLEQKMRELLGDTFNLDPDRILQEAALLAERSDIEEELARLRAHIDQFRRLLEQGGEVGKKLDFMLQEMTREANTTLSKTGSIATRSLRITELGLAMKSEIEKAREQVQNLE
ncbi:MAG TPA: YicC/YloC family endoribonuclease [Acidobacteriaceae bacterium]|nr:YicC/YloC family endoribonuclease [Acidobacteriaceae bacterium]